MTEDDESNIKPNKPKLQLPNLDDFEESYQHTIKEAHEFFNNTGDLTKPSKKMSNSKK